MLRIVASELRMNALLLFTVFVVSNLVYLFLAHAGRLLVYGPGAMQIGILTSSVMILALFLRQQQSKVEVMYRSLPLRHSTVISAMFLLVFVVLLANVAYGISLQIINVHIGPWVPERLRSYALYRLFTQTEPGYAVEHSLLARALAFTIVVSVSIPLIVRFGSMWRILLGSLLVGFLWAKAVDYLLRVSLYTSFAIGLSRWACFATLLMIASLGISFWLSVRLYGVRDT
jgi:hypothetical protein